MALSGTITGSTNNSRYSLTCEWSASQNTSANTSTITAIVYLTPPSGWNTISNYWSCVINGTAVTSNMSANISSKTELGRRTWTVNHANDGTCSTSISFSFSNRVTAGTYTVSSGSGSGNITLNSIARGSNISFNRSSATIGSDSITVNIARSSNSYTHKVQLFFGSYSTLLAENVATSYTFTPHMDLCNQIPNATSGTATIKVQTMNGSTWISESSKTITLNVPSSVVPTVGISLTANNQLNSANIAGRTTFTVKPTNAKGSYGSTIRSYSTVGQGLNTSSSSGGTSSTMGSGTYTYTVTVTDSRGRTAKASQQVTVINHESPTLSLVAYRSDSNGNKAPEGTYIHGDMTWSVFNPNNNNQNAKQYRVLKKTQNSATWSVVKDWTNLSAYSGTAKISFGNGFAVETSYDVGVEVKDSYSNVGVTQSIGTVSCLFNIEKSGVGIGKRWERGALDVGGEIYSSGRLRINGNSKEAQFGTGGSDVYIHNSKSNKYLQLKDDGTLSYSGNKIYHTGNKPTYSDIGAIQAGNWRTNGGQDLLVHNKRALVGTTDGTLHLGYGGDFSNIVCGNGHKIYHEGNKQPLRAEAGGTVISIYPYGGWTQFETWNSSGGTAKRLIWHAWSGNGGSFRPDHDGTIYLGANDRRWYAVFATTGTVSTSDARHKSITGYTDIVDCYNMVKHTDIKNYVMLQKNKEEMTDHEFRREAKSLSQRPEATQMGIIAQEIEQYKCGRYILVHSEYEDENGEKKDIYGINNYAFTSAVMGALQHHIKVTDEELDNIKQENLELKSKVDTLEQRLLRLEELIKKGDGESGSLRDDVEN